MKSFFLKKIFKKNCKSAFSLIELSIVILIVSILITGVLAVSVSNMNIVKVESAQKRIDAIYKALGFYLTANGRLPCPASMLTIKTNSSNYGESSGVGGTCSSSGVYISTVNTNLVYGMVPVKDLGLGTDFAEDGFGNKLSYVVDKRFTSSSTFGLSASNSGLITVKEITSAGSDQVNTTEAIFLIISHGVNKSGAFNANSGSQNTRSSDADEMSNDLDSITTPAFDAIFVKSTKRSDVFDDTIFYKTRNALVADFNALNLIPCEASGTNNNDVVYGATTMTWPSSSYGKIVAATGPSSGVCPAGYTGSVDKPTKKCGAYGVWEVGAIRSCAENGSGAGGGGGGGGSGVTLSCSGGELIGTNILKFASSGSLVCTGSGTITYLIVGGGGGGGGDDTDLDGGGGGGGGGGVKTGTYAVSDQTITVTVGTGGAGGTSAASPTNGSTGGTSSLGAIASATGGVGGNYGGNNVGVGGNSGAGDSTAKTGGASGTCPGPGGGGNSHGGGGGGASMLSNGTAGTQLGTNPSHGGGAGAGGTSNSITGSSVVYGGGGGGGAGGGTSEGSASPVQGGGAGGAGGGGIGNRNGVNNPGVGTDGLGGGGGGGGQADNGAAGGKGVVIISY